MGDQERFLEKVRPAGRHNPEPRALYDLVVVGAGPAGLSAARTARRLGRSVALVEQHWLGGNSLSAGSVPSKSLVRTGSAFGAIVNSRLFSAPNCGEPVADMALVMERVRAIRNRIAEYCSVDRLTAEGIDVYFGAARFADAETLSVDADTLRFEKALLATGAQPQIPKIPGLDESGFLNSKNFFDLKRLPKRLAIIGGGPLGCEMAQVFAHLGAHVTILQSEPKFLPNEERDATEILSRSLSRAGVDTWLNTEVVAARVSNGEKLIDAVNAGARYSIAVDEIMVSIGRVANTHGLCLALAGIDCDAAGDIRVDDCLRTANHRVYAAGDVCLAYKFGNAAEESARMAVLNAFGDGDHRVSRMIVPWCTFCDPEIAHVGMQLWEARGQSIAVKTFTVMMQDVDRAITDGSDDGFVKIHLRAGTDEIIGATIVASRASEMINEIAVIMHAKIGMLQLADIVHTYPAQSDAIRLAAIAYRDSLGPARSPE
jgi:pyruvate/2-oxoglutarate dehydrogenase complex dihydrolipoamide dehydrogenase (E3) component